MIKGGGKGGRVKGVEGEGLSMGGGEGMGIRERAKVGNREGDGQGWKEEEV